MITDLIQRWGEVRASSRRLLLDLTDDLCEFMASQRVPCCLGESAGAVRFAGGALVLAVSFLNAERNSQWCFKPCTRSSKSVTALETLLRIFLFTCTC